MPFNDVSVIDLTDSCPALGLGLIFLLNPNLTGLFTVPQRGLALHTSLPLPVLFPLPGFLIWRLPGWKEHGLRVPQTWV